MRWHQCLSTGEGLVFWFAWMNHTALSNGFLLLYSCSPCWVSKSYNLCMGVEETEAYIVHNSMLDAGVITNCSHNSRCAMHNVRVTTGCKWPNVNVSYTVHSFLLTRRGEQEYIYIWNVAGVSKAQALNKPWCACPPTTRQRTTEIAMMRAHTARNWRHRSPHLYTESFQMFTFTHTRRLMWRRLLGLINSQLSYFGNIAGC